LAMENMNKPFNYPELYMNIQGNVHIQVKVFPML
jgi:hypothetical protein